MSDKLFESLSAAFFKEVARYIFGSQERESEEPANLKSFMQPARPQCSAIL